MKLRLTLTAGLVWWWDYLANAWSIQVNGHHPVHKTTKDFPGHMHFISLFATEVTQMGQYLKSAF